MTGPLWRTAAFLPAVAAIDHRLKAYEGPKSQRPLMLVAARRRDCGFSQEPGVARKASAAW